MSSACKELESEIGEAGEVSWGQGCRGAFSVRLMGLQVGVGLGVGVVGVGTSRGTLANLEEERASPDPWFGSALHHPAGSSLRSPLPTEAGWR